MTTDSVQSIFNSAKKFFMGTLLSRVAGMGREICMAAAFGVQPSVAAFWMAFRFSHLLRRLFGEGGLHAAFVPHFEALRKQDPEKASRFFIQLNFGLSFLLLGLILFLETACGLALFFGHFSNGTCEVLKLTMLLLPASLFISLFTLNQSLLQCEKIFFTPSVAPAILNFFWIGAVIFLWNYPIVLAMQWLAIVLVLAFCVQWFWTVPPVTRFLSKSLGANWRMEKKEVRKEIFAMLSPFLLSLIGVAATQINSALDTLFARSASLDGPAILWYALRVQQLPLALLGVSLTGALLPPVARAISANDEVKSFELLLFSLRKAGALMIPMSFAILATGFGGIQLLFGHGIFSKEAVVSTTVCLWMYGLSLLPSTLVMILAAASYARKSYKIPTFFSFVSVALNVGLNTFFVFLCHLGALSIAVATTLAAIFNAIALFSWMKKKYPALLGALMPVYAKLLVASAVAAFLTMIFSSFFLKDPSLSLLQGQMIAITPPSLLLQCGNLCSQAAIFCVSLYAVAKGLKITDLTKLFSSATFRPVK